MLLFNTPGPANTEEVVKLCEERAGNYRFLVVASITGDSALRIARKVRNTTIICVTCPQGMHWEVDRMNDDVFAKIPELAAIRDDWRKQGLKQVAMDVTSENRLELDRLGVRIVRGSIPFFGPSFSMRLHLKHISSLDIVAKTLELISTGTIVCLESILMCTDAGVIPENIETLVVAGTERGLDTVWTIRSCASANLFHPEKGARFIELLAKPKIAVQPDIDIEYLR